MNRIATTAFALVASLCGASAQAAKWEAVTYAPKESVFFDSLSIYEENASVKATVLHDYPATNYLGDDFFPHRSRIVVYDIDCAKRELGYAQWTFHGSNLATGRTIWTGAATDIAFFSPSADSAERALMSAVCTLAIERAAATVGTAIGHAEAGAERPADVR